MNRGSTGLWLGMFAFLAFGVAAYLFYPEHAMHSSVPAIRLGGNILDTVKEGTYYMDPGGEVITREGLIPSKASGRVNTDIPGVYYIDYDFRDTAGNVAATVTRTVCVISATAATAGSGASPRKCLKDLN